MNSTQAIPILQSLADGLDPATGQPFSPDSPYQQADTVRALHAALDALRAPASPLPTPGGPESALPLPSFGAAANAVIEGAFAAAHPFTSPEGEEEWLGKIAAQCACSKVAIRARMVRLGMIPSRSAFGLLRVGANPALPQAGQPWTPEDDQRLRDGFAADTPIRDLAAAHGRTRGAINARLVKLGLITVPPVPPPSSLRVQHSALPLAPAPPPSSQPAPPPPDASFPF